MSDGKKYDGSKAQVTFNGREVRGLDSPALGAAESGVFEPLIAPEVGDEVTVTHPDGHQEVRKVASRHMVTTNDGHPAVICTFEPVGEGA